MIGQKKDVDKDTPGERNSCQLVSFTCDVVIGVFLTSSNVLLVFFVAFDFAVHESCYKV